MNLSRLDLTSLRLALACARTGSLTAAAHELHLAPAAASRRLRELEGTLGSVLFERHARGLRDQQHGGQHCRERLHGERTVVDNQRTRPERQPLQ